MRFSCFLFFVFCFLTPAASQTVLVLDQENAVAIGGVAVFSLDKKTYALSDSLGRVSLSKFRDTDVLVFQHPSFIKKHVFKRTLKKSSFVVSLTKKDFLLKEVVLSYKKSVFFESPVAFKKIIVNKPALSPGSSADLLSQSGFVFVQKSQLGGGSPVLRGFEASRVLLLFDGVRLNNAIYRSGHTQYTLSVDPFFLHKNAVGFEGGGVLFGSDALGGYIDLISLSFLKKDSVFSFFSSSFSSVNRGFKTGVGVTFSKSRFSYLSSFALNKTHDLTMGENRLHGYSDWGRVPFYFTNGTLTKNENNSVQPNTGFGSFGFFQKGLFSLKKGRELGFSHLSSSTSFIPRFDKLNDFSPEGVPVFSSWEYGPQKLSFFKISYSSFVPSFFGEKQTSFFSFQKSQESRHSQKTGELLSYHRKEDVSSFLFKTSVSAKKKKTSFFYGLDFWHNSVSSGAYSYNDSSFVSSNCLTRYPGGGSFMGDASLFFLLKKPVGSWGLSAGARGSFSYLYLLFDNVFYWGQSPQHRYKNISFVGFLRASRPFSLGSFSFGLNSAHKNPNVDDVGKFFEKNGFVTVPNTSLSSEYVYSGDFEFFYKKRGFSFSKNCFMSYIHNPITKIPSSEINLVGFSLFPDSILYDGTLLPTEANVNYGAAFVCGVSSSFSLEKEGVFLFSSVLNYTYGQNTSSRAPLSHIPPLFGKASFSFFKKDYSFSFFSFFNGRKTAERYAPGSVDNLSEATEDGSPAWFTLGFSIQKDFYSGFLFSFEANNLLDVHYKTFSSGVSSPGRGFSFSLKRVFN